MTTDRWTLALAMAKGPQVVRALDSPCSTPTRDPQGARGGPAKGGCLPFILAAGSGQLWGAGFLGPHVPHYLPRGAEERPFGTWRDFSPCPPRSTPSSSRVVVAAIP